MSSPDPRRRSGEIHVDADTPESMPAVNTIGELGILLYSHRRENKAYWKHLDHRIEVIRQDLQNINDDHQKGMQHCATHDAMLNGHDSRLKRLESADSSDELVAAIAAKVAPQVVAAASEPSWAAAAASNKSIPWAMVVLGLGIASLAVFSHRDASSLVPRVQGGSHGSGQEQPATTPSPTPVNAPVPP